MAILEGLYWLQEALRLVVEEDASRLVEVAIVASFGIGANIVEVVANPGQAIANLGQDAANLAEVVANLGQAVANLAEVVANPSQASATLAEVVANYYNCYNHHVVAIAIDYYHYNYEEGPKEYLILEPKAFVEQYRGLLHLHQLS